MKSKEQIELESLEFKIHELKLLRTKKQWIEFVRSFYTDLDELQKNRKNISGLIKLRK